jgi:hypothetical protein
MAIFATYAAYLVISVGLTVAVGSALSRSGKVFLTSVFGGDESLAGAVDHLLVVGFYLLNLGFVTLTVHTSGQIASAREAFGVLFSKIGEEFLVGRTLTSMAELQLTPRAGQTRAAIIEAALRLSVRPVTRRPRCGRSPARQGSRPATPTTTSAPRKN